MEGKRKLCSLILVLHDCLLEQNDLCCQIGNWAFPRAMFTLNSQHTVINRVKVFGLNLNSSLKNTKAGYRGLSHLIVTALLISSLLVGWQKAQHGEKSLMNQLRHWMDHTKLPCSTYLLISLFLNHPKWPVKFKTTYYAIIYHYNI